ncbi:MAG: outer membrane beta-barrel protein [Silvania sp.]|uniref:Outer membrane beta-barrel protein n=1 Tax=Silvania hatchlandensis TaxID=2926469 RepID=A0A9J6PY69_9ENTR|nr:outer membrane beta-barrel protein [Silvania hatchlandensis]MCU6663609.1 outer membrane beta-barrel protein [Silvania hatchlandensis]
MHIKIMVIAGIMVSPVAWAELTPKSHIGFAGIDFQSNVAADYGQNDNVTYQPHDSDAKSSAFMGLRPVITLTGERYQDQYLLMYSGDYRQYSSDSADNYDDHFFRFNGAWRYGLMHGLSLNLQDSLGHEQRGRGVTEGFLPDQFRQYGIRSPLTTNFFDSELRYSYGAPKGRGKGEIALGHKKLTYGNTQDAQNASADFYQYIREEEWDENSLVAEIFDQYTSQTRFRYSFITNQRRYDNDPEKDSNEYYLRYGVKTQLTGKTNVDANLSWLYKTFENNPGSKDFNGLNWDIQGEWKPLKQSTFTLRTSQSISDPSEAGGYILVTQYGLSYKHLWMNDRLSTLVDYTYTTEDYKDQNKDRHDKNGLFTVAVSYDLTPSINFGVEYHLDTLKSNKETDSFTIGPNDDQVVLRTLGYDASLIMLTAKVQI